MSKKATTPVVIGIVLILILFVGGMFMVSALGSIDTSAAEGTELEDVSGLVVQIAGLTFSIHTFVIVGLVIGILLAAFAGMIVIKRM